MYITPLTYLYFAYIFPICFKTVGSIAKSYSYIYKKEETSDARSLPSLCHNTDIGLLFSG